MRASRLGAALLTCGLAVGAQAAPLDDWLGAVDAGHAQVVVVPRLGAVLDPVGRAVRRARSHPVVGEASAESVADLTASVGVDPFDAEALAAAGVALDGPLVVATGPRGFAVVPVRDAAAAAGLIEGAVGVRPTAATVAGRSGWRWPDGAAVWVDGMLFAGRDAAAVAAVLGAAGNDSGDDGGGDLIKGCARGPGEADLYVLSRGDLAGCLTGRIDPGRVRVEWRGRVAGWSAKSWLGAPIGLPAVGAATLVAALAPGRPLDGAPPREGVGAAYAAIAAGMVRAVTLAAGPAATDLLIEVEGRDPTVAGALVERLVAAPPAGVTVAAGPGGLYTLTVTEPTADGLETAWVGARGGRLLATTRADVVAGAPLAPTKTGLSPALFEGASALLYLRPTGAPHDGRAYADALRPALAALGLEPDALGQAMGAVLFLTAHLGAAGVAVAADGEGWRVAIELETL